MRSQFHYLGRPVRSLQAMLRALSFQYAFLPRLVPDGIFGERTLEAVMLFQREFFPPVTGRVDQSTWDAISAAYQRLRADQTGPFPLSGFSGQDHIHITALQSIFQALSQVLDGVEFTPTTGILDAPTSQNLRWVQKLTQLEQTGSLDQRSWDAVNRLYRLFVFNQNAPLPSGTA